MSNSRRSSLGGGSASPLSAGSTQDLKHRVINCLNKLSDRDTLALAAAELDSIARTLPPDSFSPFLNWIHNTDDSSKTPVRKQCVTLLTLLSNSHGDALSPFLSKMISTVVRRLRDPDSAVRSACVDAVSAMAARITRPNFSSSFMKPLMETMSLEQDANSQIGAALCLAAAIEAAPFADTAQLRRSLPRLGKLAKGEGFKAKAALLVLIRSIIGAGGASSQGVLDWLVPSVVEFLSSDDWAVRKAASEALGRVAAVERDLATQYKDSCLSSLESRRFDKVKVVRETMNQTLELWKEISTGASEETPVQNPTQSRSSSTDNGISRCFPPLSKSTQDGGFKTPQPKKTVPTNWSPPSSSDGSIANSVKKGSPLKSNDKSTTKTDQSKKAVGWKVEIAVPSAPSSTATRDDDNVGKNEFAVSDYREDEHCGNPKPETKHVVFSKTREEKLHKFGGLRSGSRVVPFDEDDKHGYSEVVDGNAAEEVYDNPKDAEDLSLIREQLLQIENQQSSLLDLLQRFIGSSQSGLNSLETRVNGLEIALEEMSYNMAVSSGRIPSTDSMENTCCKLPGADFLSSKFWRRAEGRYSSPRFSSSGMMSSLNKDASAEFYKSDSRRFQHQHGGAFVSSPPADIQSNSRGLSNRMPKTIIQNSESVQACKANGFNGQ